MRKARKGFLLAAAAGIAAASIWQAQPAMAEQLMPAAADEPNVQQDGAKHGHHGRHMTKEDFEAYRLKKLQEMANYFGIQTEGKSAQQLKQELAAAKEANKEKWEAFKAEHRAKRLQHLQKLAEKHGIKTDGKTEEQLRDELMKVHGGKEMHRFKLHDKRHEKSDPKAQVPSSPEAAPVPSAEKQPS